MSTTRRKPRRKPPRERIGGGNGKGRTTVRAIRVDDHRWARWRHAATKAGVASLSDWVRPVVDEAAN